MYSFVTKTIHGQSFQLRHNIYKKDSFKYVEAKLFLFFLAPPDTNGCIESLFLYLHIQGRAVPATACMLQMASRAPTLVVQCYADGLDLPVEALMGLIRLSQTNKSPVHVKEICYLFFSALSYAHDTLVLQSYSHAQIK